MTFERKMKKVGNELISAYAKNPYKKENSVKPSKTKLWIAITLPSVFVTAAVAVLIAVNPFMNNHRSEFITGMHESKVVFNTYSAFCDYYNSEYHVFRSNPDAPYHAIIDTSSAYTGTREYVIQGIDLCQEYDIDCVNNPTDKHYLDVTRVYERCVLPSNYVVILSFWNCDENLITNDLNWQKFVSTEEEVTFYEVEEDGIHDSRYYYFYNLKSNGNTIAKFEAHYLPVATSDSYEEAIEQMDDIRNEILNLYQAKYGE